MEYYEFRQQYEQQHPASVPQMESEMNEYPGWVRPAVLTTFICAALVSGVHTVPTVWKSIEVGEIILPAVRNIISVASLVAVELAILLSAYLMARGVKLAYFVTFIASAVAVMANLYSVVTAFNTSDDKGALAVAVVLGIGAPLIALFTGKMFVDIHRADRKQDAQTRHAFREASVAWDKEIEKAYKAFLKSNSVSNVQLSNVSNGQSIGQPAASTLGHTKVQDASRIVEEYLSTHPEAMDYSPRTLGDLLGVGKSTVNNVQRRLREKVTMNGHYESEADHDR